MERPNHIHLLIAIRKDKRAIHESPLQNRSPLSKVIGYLKVNISRDIHNTGYDNTIFQRSCHDHIILSETDHRRIWAYTDTNPAKWGQNCFYVAE